MGKRKPVEPRAKRDANEAARELWRAEGQKALAVTVDTKIDQVRADAEALEVAARILDSAPRGIFPVPHKAETVAALYALAAGMRLAAGRMPDSRELPF